MENLIDHLEKHLGEIQGGLNLSDKEEMPFQLVKFTESLISNTIIYSTLGLSDFELEIKHNKRKIRQELIFLARPKIDENEICSILYQLGLEAIKDCRAYLRGEVIGPRGCLINKSKMESVYITIPVYFPETFHVYYPDYGDPIVISWIVPITNIEAEYIKTHGYMLFEEQLQKNDPDLIDVFRDSISVCH